MNLPANVCAVKDRHGKVRYRFRKKGLPSRYTPEPGSEDFEAFYQKCFDPDFPVAIRGPKEPEPVIRRSFARYAGRKLVYFIGGRGTVKIGKTVNLYARLKKLQTGSPFRLQILATVDGGAETEVAYHEQFAAARLSGEWFRKTPEVMAEVARLRAADAQRWTTNQMSNSNCRRKA